MKVSIITVTYNSAETLKDTIESVVSQDYPDIEYLIVDGQSTDNTLEITKSYASQIDQVVSEQDQGMYDALNKGIELATGEIIAILNSDDFYAYPQVISEIVQLFEKEQADAAYADLVYVERHNPKRVKRYWKSGKYRINKFKWGWMPPHPTFFVRRACYEKYGKFNIHLRSAADYELMLRFIHRYQINLAYLPKVIVKMREGGMSNLNLIARLRGNQEDQKAWRINGLKTGKLTFFLKPFRKLFQFIRLNREL